MTAVRAVHRGHPIKWFVGFIISVHLLAGAWSADRAWKQVRSLEVRVAGPLMAAGSAPRIDVVTSGRVTVTVTVTLVQGARADTIGVQTIGGHRDGFWDPRFISKSFAPVLTPTQVARYAAGPAVVRAVANGRPQWLRVPPPVVREVSVTLVRS